MEYNHYYFCFIFFYEYLYISLKDPLIDMDENDDYNMFLNHLNETYILDFYSFIYYLNIVVIIIANLYFIEI
jgi:hypothetical protein